MLYTCTVVLHESGLVPVDMETSVPLVDSTVL